jgi:PadR family transcriptional regulator, regulatory protein PadR
MASESAGLLQGTVDVLVLRALLRAPMHGYAVSEWVRDRTNGTITIEDAALYKALHRLEREGAVVAEWGLSDTSRKARFYRLSASGRRLLNVREAAWRRYVAAMDLALEPAT